MIIIQNLSGKANLSTLIAWLDDNKTRLPRPTGARSKTNRRAPIRPSESRGNAGKKRHNNNACPSDPSKRWWWRRACVSNHSERREREGEGERARRGLGGRGEEGGEERSRLRNANARRVSRMLPLLRVGVCRSSR